MKKLILVHRYVFVILSTPEPHTTLFLGRKSYDGHPIPEAEIFVTKIHPSQNSNQQPLNRSGSYV